MSEIAPPPPAPTPRRYVKPLVAVDVVAFTVLDADLKVLLITRKLAPFLGGSALPGGFLRCGDGVVDQGEDLIDAARRELFEETRLPVERVPLTQLRVFGAPDRDPRTRVISVAYTALVAPELAAFVRAGSDAATVTWRSVSLLDRTELAFDHRAIVDTALARLREDIDETTAARALVPSVFSVAELRAVVEAVHGRATDPGNFRRRFQRLVDEAIVEPAPGTRVTGRRRAHVFRFREGQAAGNA
jgi:8-oxo-dGTP diphosphatase